MSKYLKDTDQTEKQLLTDLFNILEYENNGRLTAHKLTLLAREKFNIHIDDDQAKEMFIVLGVKRGEEKTNARCGEAAGPAEAGDYYELVDVSNSVDAHAKLIIALLDDVNPAVRARPLFVEPVLQTARVKNV